MKCVINNKAITKLSEVEYETRLKNYKGNKLHLITRIIYIFIIVFLLVLITFLNKQEMVMIVSSVSLIIISFLYITNEHDFYFIRNNRISRYVTYARIIEKLPPKKLKKKVIIGVKKYNLSFADYLLIVEDIETGYKYEYLAFSLEYSYLGNGLYIKNSIYKDEKYNYDKNVNDIIEIYVNSDEVEKVIYSKN